MRITEENETYTSKVDQNRGSRRKEVKQKKRHR